MASSVDLNPNYLETVVRILAEHVPECEVRAFGSRATWTAKDYSDLDLAIVGEGPLDRKTLGRLKEAFEESSLPMRVDVLDWHATSESFRDVIERDYVVVQKEAGTQATAKEWRETVYGKFPDHFRVDTLGNLCVGGNGIQTGPFGSQLHQRDYVSEGTPIITVEHLGQNRITTQDLPRVSDYDRMRLSKYALQKGDIVFSRVGSVDRRALVRQEEEGWLFSGRCLRVRPDPSKIDAGYTSYFFGLDSFQEYIRAIAVGATMPSLNTQILSDVPILYPPLPAQRAIAHVLGALDDKIELNRRRNQTLEAMARALFQDWFVDFGPTRAKLEGRKPYLPPEVWSLFPDQLADSELGPLPEGWQVRALGEVIEINPARLLRKGAVAPYLDMANMPTNGHTPDEVTERPFGSGMRFVNGDTLVARITPCLENGKTAYVDFLQDGEVGWGSTEYIVMKPKPPLPEEFAYCLARSATFREFAIQNMTGTSGRQRVPAAAMFNYQLPLPNECQVAEVFGELVKPLFSLVSWNTEESRTLSAQRDTLLPRLVSGEVRVGGWANEMRC